MRAGASGRGLSPPDAIRQVAAETGLAKNQLYDAALRAQPANGVKTPCL